MQIESWVPPWERHQFADLPQREQHLFADLHASLCIPVLVKQQPDTFSGGEIYMRDGTFEVVCISGLTAVNKTEADWATARQSTYEQCLKWFSHTAVAWMDYYAAARPSWDVDYALPALQQHITLICKPIALLIKGLQQHQNENITLTHVNIIDAFVLCVCAVSPSCHTMYFRSGLSMGLFVQKARDCYRCKFGTLLHLVCHSTHTSNTGVLAHGTVLQLG